MQRGRLRPEPSTYVVKISVKWARLRFACARHHILNVCHGRCCSKSGHIPRVFLLPEELKAHKKRGLKIRCKYFVAPNPETGLCPYSDSYGLCSLHHTGEKPFGCIVSPFMLNKNKTLTIQRRYTSLKDCAGKRIPPSSKSKPAYKTFRASLDILFGKKEASRIVKELDQGRTNIYGKMSRETFEKVDLIQTTRRTISE